ncbi:P-loop NTPase fold protein [Nevskia sp.]|uniref:KAP family P-loop NTPase fold protein n=1 Tax=Nevskia sp. TaxID=1929292 RepID=UPI0025E1DD70|nr:P-loop NTPase fold protein [Nevskia sp.]
MRANRFGIGPPDYFIYLRVMATGWLLTETGQLSFLLGGNAPAITHDCVAIMLLIGIVVLVALIGVYLSWRGGWTGIGRIAASARIDVAGVFALGLWADSVTSSVLLPVRKLVVGAGPEVPLLVLAVLVAMVVAPTVRHALFLFRKPDDSSKFLSDDDISHRDEDLLDRDSDAKAFADALHENGGTSSFVFGVDGPWGIGKSSFMNLVEAHLWSIGKGSVLVFRFEPLRYAMETDLPAKFIRDLVAQIDKVTFAPEFPTAVSRYSRMLRGTADVSFLGFKLSLAPTPETVDEALESIDDVLKRLRKRLVVVIDDLDRLDTDAVNNVLFAVRRTFNLSQATYVLCYDSEVLASQGERASRTRQFLEKFVTVQVSLFAPTSYLISFLRSDWKSDQRRLQSIPAATMLRLSSVCTALADLLESKAAAQYQLIAGNLRKVKRFVNASLLMRMENFDISGSDFYATDLVHLILLHLNYPGLFRELYAEETGGRTGRFSARRMQETSGRRWVNALDFPHVLNHCPDDSARFLVRQLFDVDTIEIDSWAHRDEQTFFQGRACFNEPHKRTLEKYLELIVRFALPDPLDSLRFYLNVVVELKNGVTIADLFTRKEFGQGSKPETHRKFWQVVTDQSRTFSRATADEAIDGLVASLPRYSFIGEMFWAARSSAVYSLCQLLDNAGWGKELSRVNNSAENIADIAFRIFGEGDHKGRGILQRLSASGRGALGWRDLMLFRLTCSADRGVQLYNLTNSLVRYQVADGPTQGPVAEIAKVEMRCISQAVFSLFRNRYIDPCLNFYDDVDLITDDQWHGDLEAEGGSSLHEERNALKSFVIYQLTNSYGASNNGIGCGFYDEDGAADQHGIATAMNRYLFDVCFDVSRSKQNATHFADHCLRSLKDSFFQGAAGRGYTVTEAGIIGFLDREALSSYWLSSRDQIREMGLTDQDREMRLGNYVANYGIDLPRAFEVLDRMVDG